jgi:hypothetical protein
MDERYGAEQSQLIPDVQWIEETTLAGQVLLAKDLRIANNLLEATAVFQTSARVFALARRDIDGLTMAQYFLANESRIMSMARRVPGPYVVAVSREGLRRVRLNHM